VESHISRKTSEMWGTRRCGGARAIKRVPCTFERRRLPVHNRGDFFLVGKNGFLIRQDRFLIGENFIQNGLILQDCRLIVEQRFLIFQNGRLVAEDGFLIDYNFLI
jgi:hypothetical protein